MLVLLYTFIFMLSTLPISREAVDWDSRSDRSVQSLWPHIASVIHESAVQHSDSITACSQHRVIRWLWRMPINYMLSAYSSNNYIQRFT